MRKYSWELTDGRKVTLEAEYSEELREKEIGGYRFPGKKEVKADGNLVVYIEGVEIDRSWDANFWTIVDVRPGIKRIWGIDKIGFTDERAVEIDAFLKSVIEEGKPEDVKAFEAEQAAVEKENRRKELEDFLVKASKHQLYTEEEARRERKLWNDTYNEGGEGFVPKFYTYKEVEDAKKELEEITNDDKRD